MNKANVLDRFKRELNSEIIKIDEPMKYHTTFKVGGPADILILPSKEEELAKVVKICNEENTPLLLIGNGSNLLVRDGGIRGVVVKLNDQFASIEVAENIIRAKSGAILSKVSKVALGNSLKGFEFGSGIPGTIGGAVTMNAGAYGGEMSEVVKAVRCIDRLGNIVRYTKDEMNFGYRKSRVQEEGLIVIEAELELKSGIYDEIKSNVDELTEKRTTKQPLDLASGGSTFKRPEGHFAGKLIEDAGLRGFRHRNVQVSEKHCGFVVNLGDSTARDVVNLIETVQKIVYDKFGVMLEPEVRIIGEE